LERFKFESDVFLIIIFKHGNLTVFGRFQHQRKHAPKALHIENSPLRAHPGQKAVERHHTSLRPQSNRYSQGSEKGNFAKFKLRSSYIDQKHSPCMIFNDIYFLAILRINRRIELYMLLGLLSTWFA
jgi:hypothetical protein